MAEDNLTQEANADEIDIINEFVGKKKLEKSWFPLMSYDMIQAGYPRPNHGVMVARAFGGTNSQGELLNGGGMWCKVEDVKKYMEIILASRQGSWSYKIVDNFLSSTRCDELVRAADLKGYEEADISYSTGAKMNKEYRNNERCLYTDENLRIELEEKLKNIAPPVIYAKGKKGTFLRVSGRFRFYKYNPPQLFKKHRDASEAEEGGVSIFTVLIYLNTAEEGGETRIYDQSKPEKILIEAEKGRMLTFSHDIAHTGEELKKGTKIVLRTDLIYKFDESDDKKDA